MRDQRDDRGERLRAAEDVLAAVALVPVVVLLEDEVVALVDQQREARVLLGELGGGAEVELGARALGLLGGERQAGGGEEQEGEDPHVFMLAAWARLGTCAPTSSRSPWFRA